MSQLLPDPAPDSGEPLAPLPAPLTTESAPILMSFFSASGAELALQRSEFTQEELIRKLVDHVRHPNPKVSQGGTRLFLQYLRGVAAANGAFARAQLTHHGSDAHGNPLTSTLTSTVLNGLARPLPPATPDGGRTFHPPGVASQAPVHPGPADRNLPEAPGV